MRVGVSRSEGASLFIIESSSLFIFIFIFIFIFKLCIHSRVKLKIHTREQAVRRTEKNRLGAFFNHVARASRSKGISQFMLESSSLFMLESSSLFMLESSSLFMLESSSLVILSIIFESSYLHAV